MTAKRSATLSSQTASGNTEQIPAADAHHDDAWADGSAVLPELIRSLQDGAGLSGLAERLAESMKCHVVVTDVNGSVLAKASAAAQANTMSTDFSAGAAADELAIPLSYNGKCAGHLDVFRSELAFTVEDRRLVSLAAGLLCVQLAQDEKIADIELRLKGDFIADLISARYSDPESILTRARALDYDITAPQRVFVATIDNLEQLLEHASDDGERGQIRAEFVQRIQSRLNQRAKGMVVSGKNEFIILVRHTKSDNIKDSKALAEQIISETETAFKGKMYIGIGRICLALGDFAQSYLEAKKALEIGEYMITEGQVRSFEQFKVHALFLSTLKPAELYNYAREQLDAILLYDEKHHTDFLKTLQEFLYLRNNVEGTAKSIGLSVSGLKYRLQKIEKILGNDLKDYKVCFDLQLALVILQLFGDYQA